MNILKKNIFTEIDAKIQFFYQMYQNIMEIEL